jgi:TolB-like protein
VVGAWVALQIVEVLAGAGLPPSTMRNLLIVLSFGFPLALIVGWFFDISKEGVVKTGPLKQGEQLPRLKFIDHILLVGLILVVAMDGYILSFPPPAETPVVVSSASQQRTIAVLGFNDLELAEGDDPVGDVFAGELRSSLTRIAGLRVLGPRTSKILSMAGEDKYETAKELLVTAIVSGEVLLEGGHIRVNARLVGIPAGNEIWSSSVEAPVGDAIELQQGLLRQLIGAVAPNLDPDPVGGPRAEAGDCSDVYELYLHGKQLSQRGVSRKRGVEMLREAVAIDDQCALAWEAIAMASVNWTMSGFAKAGAAARRALELNDSLPEAWVVLAEIAEEEMRWTDSEEYFLRALYADPTSVRANELYGETLLARGRVKDGLHYSLEAYRYEPVYDVHMSLAAMMTGNGELALKHAALVGERYGKSAFFAVSLMAEGYLILGETEQALEQYRLLGDDNASWFLQCISARQDPSQWPGIAHAMKATLKQYKSGELNEKQEFFWGWQMIRCGTWIGEADLVLDYVLDGDHPTENKFLVLFNPDAGVLRRHPRFYSLVEETGLLDYWRKWGWSDYCEADGDSFRCD